MGNVSLGLLEDIKKIIAHIAQQNSRFTMSIGQLGAFPTIDHPRVIWVGLDQGKEQAVHLAKILEEKLQHFGFLSEKRSFKPHLTLGRVRSSRNRDQLKKLIQNITIPEQTIQIKTLTLFKSTLTPEGALYQPLLEAKLG